MAKIWGLCNEKTEKEIFFLFFIINSINVGPSNKAVGPGKKSKINKHRAYIYSSGV